jgi:hypothetical protein
MRSAVLAAYAVLSFIPASVTYMCAHATLDDSPMQPSEYSGGGGGANQELADAGGGNASSHAISYPESTWRLPASWSGRCGLRGPLPQ